jgi:hypothetical protein
MLRKLYLVPVLALLLVPAVASAQFEQGNFSLELAGDGGTDHDWTEASAGISFELGYFVSKELMVGVRQGISWSDAGGPGSFMDGSTRIVANYHFDMDKWQPYVGASLGYAYGDLTEDDWFAGPELGVKYFVNSTTYVDLVVAYDFLLCEGLDEGSYRYGLGIGFRW